MGKGKKDPHICWTCQRGRVEYRVNRSGQKMEHGVCRFCYEISTNPGHTAKGGGPGGPINCRTKEMMENEYETKHGTGHG